MSESEILELNQTPPCEIENCIVCSLKPETIQILMEDDSVPATE